MKKYDVVVIGGGPGGYVAAIRAAKLGCSVALVEADQLGGTCLNRGCIPSKTLLHHAEIIEQIRKASSWGIETGEMRFSFAKMNARKDQVIMRLRTGIASLLKEGKIEHFKGFGSVHADNTISIQSGDKVETIIAERIILATGSTPFVPNIIGINQVDIHTSDTILDIKEIPSSIVIIGGGVIGVEFACIFASLNTEVTIIEMAETILPNEDPEAAKVLHKALQKKNIKIQTHAKVEVLRQNETDKLVLFQTKDGSTISIACDQILVAIGRKPNLSALSELSIKMEGSYVSVNKNMETSIPGIYAVGDLVGGWQLAHVASAEGMVAAANAAGKIQEIDYSIVPRCVYTLPEIASVGLMEREAKEKGYAVKVGIHHLVGNGKALAMDGREGFVKIIAEEKYGEILGTVMVGPHVTEIISEVAAFMKLEGTLEELGSMIHPHPSLSESIYEAAISWLEKGLHK